MISQKYAWFELDNSTQTEATHPVWQQHIWLFDTWTPHKANVLQQVLNSMDNNKITIYYNHYIIIIIK